MHRMNSSKLSKTTAAFLHSSLATYAVGFRFSFALSEVFDQLSGKRLDKQILEKCAVGNSVRMPVSWVSFGKWLWITHGVRSYGLHLRPTPQWMSSYWCRQSTRAETIPRRGGGKPWWKKTDLLFATVSKRPVLNFSFVHLNFRRQLNSVRSYGIILGTKEVKNLLVGTVKS